VERRRAQYPREQQFSGLPSFGSTAPSGRVALAEGGQHTDLVAEAPDSFAPMAASYEEMRITGWTYTKVSRRPPSAP